MNIPENGRVVIIDDKVEDEGFPLIRALTKKNVPIVYYSGNLEELPSKPLKGIRIIFLDIVLGTDGQPPKTQVATAVNIMKKIISTDNGPYLLVAWTKHEEHIPKIKAALKDRPPTLVLNLEKSSCRKRDGAFSISKIEKKIKSELKKAESFHLFTIWENLLHQAAGDTVNDFSSFYPINENWNNNMSSVFYCLAKAYAGDKANSMKNHEILQNALLTLTTAFADNLESYIKNNSFKQDTIKKIAIPADISSKINNKLLLFFDNNTKKPAPGNTYKSTPKFGVKFELKEIYNGDLDSYPQKVDLISKVKYIFLESSTACDHAQNGLRVHRTLSGVLWPYEHDRKIKKADFIYKTPLFEIDNNVYRIVFNLRYLTSMPLKKLNNKKNIFRIRHSLLVDIQSHIARHIHRPGITSV